MAKSKYHDLPELKLAKSIADLLDDAFVLPGTKFRFGLDPILGLFPVAGDGVSLILSVLVVHT